MEGSGLFCLQTKTKLKYTRKNPLNLERSPTCTHPVLVRRIQDQWEIGGYGAHNVVVIFGGRIVKCSLDIDVEVSGLYV